MARWVRELPRLAMDRFMKEEQKLDTELAKRLTQARRIVIKLGTSTVTGAEGNLCAERVEPIVGSIAQLVKAGRQVVMVSSGAVGLGRAWLGLHQSRLRDLVTKQACAAVGQSLLMDAYKRMFSAWEIKIAQVLLTEEDFTVWRRHENLQHTIEKLLQFGVIPIINENDTVSTAEIASLEEGSRAPAFSDNDRLAALVMSGLEADALVLLTNVDGLLRTNGAGSHGERAKPEVIALVDEITPELRALAAGPSQSGRGGMLTKLEAADIAMQCGGTAVIANGQSPDIVGRIFAGERVGTAFLPLERVRGKRRWIAFAADVQGRVVVDAGARDAILNGKASLLSSGVVRIESHFAPKDVISILDREGKEFARGIANCASHDAEDAHEAAGDAPGTKNSQAKGVAAPASRVLVRRDNIVVLRK
jgi:glutamate 5-kinase